MSLTEKQYDPYSKGKDLYKGISLVFQRNVPRDFYGKMNKSEMPKGIKISDKNGFKIDPSPTVEDMERIAKEDTGQTLFFSHRSPDQVERLLNWEIQSCKK